MHRFWTHFWPSASRIGFQMVQSRSEAMHLGGQTSQKGPNQPKCAPFTTPQVHEYSGGNLFIPCGPKFGPVLGHKVGDGPRSRGGQGRMVTFSPLSQPKAQPTNPNPSQPTMYIIIIGLSQNSRIGFLAVRWSEHNLCTKELKPRDLPGDTLGFKSIKAPPLSLLR